MVSRAESFERVVLETSLKPFASFSEEDIDATARQIVHAWAPLLGRCRSVAVLLWISDGSELLDWAGDDDDSVEWARWVGFNNTSYDPYGHNVTPDRTAVPYRADAPTLDYAGIRRVVAGIRKAVAEFTGVPVEIGATVDSGPEFAPSAFKFERHPEIMADGEATGVGKVIRMVQPWGKLSGDDRRYAAYPDGLPEHTPFGEFLGRQANAYLTAMGFDYLWLSNGFGFSGYSWTVLGETFDGTRFRSDHASDVRARILDFWNKFAATVGYPVEVRGTNFGIGMDIATDAVPSREIYESPVLRAPPPNSPWGPLNRDFGIELTGTLSRIARLPGGGFPFRFYASDSWFWQTPWRDFYGGEPFDIHLPLSLSRIDENGRIGIASDIEILTVDSHRGEIDPTHGAEISVFVERSRRAAPDEAAPLVWMYPFDAYHDTLEQAPETIGQPFFEDWLVSAAMNAGLPLASVLDVADAAGALDSGALDRSVLLTPASGLDERGCAAVERALARGVDVVVYGSPALHEGAARLVGVSVDTSESSGDEDEIPLTGVFGDGTLAHNSVLSGGPLRERAAASSDVKVLATAAGHPYATERSVGRGVLRWLRGSSDFEISAEDDHGLRSPLPLDRTRYASPARMLVELVGRTGWRTDTHPGTASSYPVVTFSRSNGALRVAAYVADTTAQVALQTPYGAPLLTGLSAKLDGDAAVYSLSTSTHREARVFVRQARTNTITVTELAPFPCGVDRLLSVTGLIDAIVTLLLPPGASPLDVTTDGQIASATTTADSIIVSGATGDLRFGWWRADAGR